MNAVLESLCRGGLRFALLLLLAVQCLVISHLVEPPLPAWVAPIYFGIGLTVLSVAFGDVVLRILQPRVDASDAAKRAVNFGSMPAAIVYFARTLFAIAMMFLMAGSSRADEPPAAAKMLLPILKHEQRTHWPSMPLPPALGAQVEQETCPSLKHRKCWNPRTELRTSREQGLGLGQFTRAFRADGSTRFDAMSEIVRAHPKELAGMSWANPYEPVLQLRALVLKDRGLFDQARWAADWRERLAFMLAAYNGGMGGVLSDRQQCRATPGCDPSRWFGHVEHTSLKAKRAVHGYGKSFFEINREYPRNILGPRLARYQLLADINPIYLVEKTGQLAS